MSRKLVRFLKQHDSDYGSSHPHGTGDLQIIRDFARSSIYLRALATFSLRI